MLRAAGLREVLRRNAVLAVTEDHPYKRLPLQFAVSLRKLLLEGGLILEIQLDDCLSDAAAVAEDPGSVMTTFIVAPVPALQFRDLEFLKGDQGVCWVVMPCPNPKRWFWIGTNLQINQRYAVLNRFLL